MQQMCRSRHSNTRSLLYSLVQEMTRNGDQVRQELDDTKRRLDGEITALKAKLGDVDDRYNEILAQKKAAGSVADAVVPCVRGCSPSASPALLC